MALIRKTVLSERQRVVLFFGLTPSTEAFSFSYSSERSLNPPPLMSEYDFDILTPAGFGCESDQKSARQTRIYFFFGS